MSDPTSQLLATAFERIDGQWVWYAKAWSRGVIVNEDERDLFLAFKPLAFRQAIKGRPTSHPRRSYWATLNRILVAGLAGRDPQDERR